MGPNQDGGSVHLSVAFIRQPGPRCAIRFPSACAAANRGTAFTTPRCICRRQRIGVVPSRGAMGCHRMGPNEDTASVHLSVTFRRQLPSRGAMKGAAVDRRSREAMKGAAVDRCSREAMKSAQVDRRSRGAFGAVRVRHLWKYVSAAIYRKCPVLSLPSRGGGSRRLTER